MTHAVNFLFQWISLFRSIVQIHAYWAPISAVDGPHFTQNWVPIKLVLGPPSMWEQCTMCIADLIDVTLADEDSNSIPTDDINRAWFDYQCLVFTTYQSFKAKIQDKPWPLKNHRWQWFDGKTIGKTNGTYRQQWFACKKTIEKSLTPNLDLDQNRWPFHYAQKKHSFGLVVPLATFLLLLSTFFFLQSNLFLGISDSPMRNFASFSRTISSDLTNK